VAPDQSIFLLQSALRFTFGAGAIFGVLLGFFLTALFIRVSFLRSKVSHMCQFWLFRRPAFQEFLIIMSFVTSATIACAFWWGINPPNVGKLLKLLAV